MAIKFSPEVLRSDKTLNAYLYGKETIEAIKAEAKQPYMAKGYGRLGTLEVVWSIGTLPLNIISSLFLQAIGNLLYLLYARELSQKLLVQANYMGQSSLRWIPSVLYGKNLLVSTVNALSPDKAEEVYTHPPLRLDKLKSNIILRSIGYTRNNHIDFNKIDGQCAGMSNWTAHLYFQTKAAFRNEEHHLVAVTSKLANGAGKEAALWQCMQKDGSNFSEREKIVPKALASLRQGQELLAKLKKSGMDEQAKALQPWIRTLKVLANSSHHKIPPLLGIKSTPIDQLIKPTADKIAKLFKNLQPGFYAVRTPKHRFNFIKGEKSDYMMEPGEGLIAIRSNKELEEHTMRLVDKAKVEVSRLSGS